MACGLHQIGGRCKFCIKLHKFLHILTVIVCTKFQENKPQNLYKMYERPHICLTGSSQYRTLLENAVTSCAELFQESSDFKEISQKLFLLKDNIFEKCCSAVERDENGLNVLTHGDLWMNNIMFKCDDNVDGALVDVLFVSNFKLL